MHSSHLTRAVFRAIVANRPFVAAECLRLTHRQSPLLIFSQIKQCRQKRGLFTALLGSSNRGFEGARSTPRNLEIALGKLVDLLRAQRTSARPPPDIELVDAFRFLFTAHLELQRRLTRNDVYLATAAFKHFVQRGLIADEAAPAALGKTDLDIILQTLALPSTREKFRTDTGALARLVFASFSSALGGESSDMRSFQSLLSAYSIALASTGSAEEVLQILLSDQKGGALNDVRIWIEVLRGLEAQGSMSQRHSAFEHFLTVLPKYNTKDYERLVIYLAANNKIDDMQKVLEVQIRTGVELTTTELRELVESCALSREFSWGEQFFRKLRGRTDDDRALNALFVWLAARTPDSVYLKEELEKVIHDSSLTLSMAPFNRLLDFALRTGRDDLAAEAIRFAEYFDLRPDGKTCVLQLENALSHGDLTKAEHVYESLVREDIPSDQSDLSALNKLAAALAFAPDVNYVLLMQVVDTLLERNAELDAETLAGLCQVFLQRDELEDATGLLRHRADSLPSVDRARVSAVFQNFVLDVSISDQRAWNAYELFRHAFPETSVEDRLPLMQAFFDRERSDLACLIFGHMRQREDAEARPTPEAYAHCFAGIAKCRDVDGLQMVYNMLKLDLEVEPHTRIRNGLMLAYIACQMPFSAMIDHFWKIMDSREGPSYSTFEIGLRACETWVPVGGHEARKIIAVMQAWNLEITKELYDCYVGAIAGQSEFEYAVELIEEMEKEIGISPDAVTIGTFYNAIPWQYRKDEVEKWARQAYPDLWEELVTYGDEIDEEWEIRYFKIDRTIPIDDDLLFAPGQYDPQIAREAVKALEPVREKSS